MKIMTCKQLGGACDKEFKAESFEEIAELSKKHGMEMFKKNDQEHLKGMNEMQLIMNKPGGLDRWMKEKQDLFNSIAPL